MMVSTKGRYALIVCLDLAQQDPEAYISLREVAQRQNISMKYLESIVAMLNRQMKRMADVLARRYHVNQLVGNILRMAGHKPQTIFARYGIQPFYRRSFLKKQGYWHD